MQNRFGPQIVAHKRAPHDEAAKEVEQLEIREGKLHAEQVAHRARGERERRVRAQPEGAEQRECHADDTDVERPEGDDVRAVLAELRLHQRQEEQVQREQRQRRVPGSDEGSGGAGGGGEEVRVVLDEEVVAREVEAMVTRGWQAAYSHSSASSTGSPLSTGSSRWMAVT